MSNFELKMPRLGESITEATITRWIKQVGEPIDIDEPILEIATDKVDSEIPSPVAGILKEQRYNEGETAAVESIIAIIEVNAEASDSKSTAEESDSKPTEDESHSKPTATESKQGGHTDKPLQSSGGSDKYYSPLVRNIARQEGLSLQMLDTIKGSGKHGRLTKADLAEYLKQHKGPSVPLSSASISPLQGNKTHGVRADEGDEIIVMDRIRKLISEHMLMSEATSVHITLFASVDMTRLVHWRNQQKEVLLKRDNEKLTFTPIFIEAIAKALLDYPMVNISLDGDSIIKRKNINIGMATALPNGNLIVPVIKNADHKNLLGLTKEVNDLANRARNNQLKPEEIQGGTFTLTNFGTFGATSGTPIIYQPQVAILGVGLIEKKPAVIETPQGDAIAIRHKMVLSLSCDHRIVDGALGSQFMKRVAEYLEHFDTNQNI